MKHENNIGTSKEIVSNRNARKEMLEELKRAVLETTSRTNTDGNYQDYNFPSLDDNQTSQNSVLGQGGNSYTKSTAYGKAFSDKEQGFTSALMLGIMSFVIEIAFLALAFFMYQ